MAGAACSGEETPDNFERPAIMLCLIRKSQLSAAAPGAEWAVLVTELIRVCAD
jgi:hypothetical protein